MNAIVTNKIASAFERGKSTVKINGKAIHLPQAQTAGTMTQQRTHGRMILQRLRDGNFEIFKNEILFLTH